MPCRGDDALMALMQMEKQRFIADYVEQSVLAAADDGQALHYTENGMVEPTAYGQRLEEDAACAAEEIFARVLDHYLAEAANFGPDGPYNDVVEHVGNEFKPVLNADERDVFERISEAHFKHLQKAALPPTEHAQISDMALILLKKPLEFADLNIEGLLNSREKTVFSEIIQKLRRLAKMDPVLF